MCGAHDSGFRRLILGSIDVCCLNSKSVRQVDSCRIIALDHITHYTGFVAAYIAPHLGNFQLQSAVGCFAMLTMVFNERAQDMDVVAIQSQVLLALLGKPRHVLLALLHDNSKKIVAVTCHMDQNGWQLSLVTWTKTLCHQDHPCNASAWHSGVKVHQGTALRPSALHPCKAHEQHCIRVVHEPQDL